MRITDSAAIGRILKAIADPENVKIMSRIRKEAKSAQMLASETGIPQSTVYRKLEELKEAGLAMTGRYIVTAGKKVEFMTVTFSDLRMSIEEGGLGIEIVPSDETASLRWLSLFRGS